MTRKIKFRAWDDFQKKFVFEGFHVIGEVTCFGGMESEIHRTWKERSEAKGYSGTIEAWNDFTLQEWTDLTDKNGREIYEGDIVRFDVPEGCSNEKAMRNQVGDVNYGHGMFNFGTWGCIWCVNTQVIGNIHENPDLLEPAARPRGEG